MALNSESIAYWYFRLNGFFTFKNFVVHPESGNEPRTEADVLGLRLPHRRELLHDPMEDDERFTGFANKSFLVIGEVKLGGIRFNPTWRRPELRNVEAFLSAAGAFRKDRVPAIAEAIYTTGAFEDDAYRVCLAGIGTDQSPVLQRQLPNALQITWRDIALFVFNRFSRHREVKMIHYQWDEAGQDLWKTWTRCDRAAEFADAIESLVNAERPAQAG